MPTSHGKDANNEWQVPVSHDGGLKTGCAGVALAACSQDTHHQDGNVETPDHHQTNHIHNHRSSPTGLCKLRTYRKLSHLKNKTNEGFCN